MTRENNRPASEINKIIRNALKNNAPVQKIFHRGSGQMALKIGNKSPIIVLPIWAIVRFKKNNYDMNNETHNIIQSYLANSAVREFLSKDKESIQLARNEIENSYILCKENCDIQLLIETHQIKFENKLYLMDADTRKQVDDYMHKLAKRERGIKFAYAMYVMIVICVAGLAGLLGGAISNYYAKERKKAKVEEKVSAFEKTLPGYLEQKQRVEHFRDSLMNAKEY